MLFILIFRNCMFFSSYSLEVLKQTEILINSRNIGHKTLWVSDRNVYDIYNNIGLRNKNDYIIQGNIHFLCLEKILIELITLLM